MWPWGRAPGSEATEYGAGALRLEVRVWQGVENERDIHAGARPADGSWRTLGMIPLPLDDGVSSAGYRYGNIALDVQVPSWEPPVAVEVRVWQGVVRPGVIYISARPARGSWLALGTVRLLLDDGITSTGHRFGDISLEVPLPTHSVTTLTGRPGERGYLDGQRSEALFGRYFEDLGLGVAVDRDGSVVVADHNNRAIRRISPDGTVTTIAGGNGRGVRDGPADTAQFVEPADVAIAPDGSIYVADILRATAFARSRRTGSSLRWPAAVPSSDTHTRRARTEPLPMAGRQTRGSPFPSASPSMTTATCTSSSLTGASDGSRHQGGSRPSPERPVLAIGTQGYGGGYQDGPAAQARFHEPAALVFDHEGNLLIAERGNSRIRLLSPDGDVSTIAGAARLPLPGRNQGNPGSRDGYANSALFFSPDGIAIDREGNIFFTESNSAIRMIDQQGFVSTVLRTPDLRYGGELSPGIGGIAVGADGALYVADADYGRVVRVTRDGMLSIVAEGLSSPEGILALPGGALLVSDPGDNVIFQITFEDEH